MTPTEEPREVIPVINWDVCLWCGLPFTVFGLEGADWPFCSPACAVLASVDDEEPRDHRGVR